VPDGTLVEVDPLDVPGWSADGMGKALAAFQSGCVRLLSLPPETALGGAGLAQSLGGQARDWQDACKVAAVTDIANDADSRAFFENWFSLYRVMGAASFTGYYDIEIPGTIMRNAANRIPVYARPADLVSTGEGAARKIGRIAQGQLVPYFTRAEIAAGALGREAHAIAYVQNAADLFFLQIQGSGRIRLPHGGLLRVVYDGKNGRPYTPIGRVLVAQGVLREDQINLPNLRHWLAAHPELAESVMNKNESYVFFRAVETPEAASISPPGALGVALTPARAAAVDTRYVPLGAPVFIETINPLTAAPWRHVLVAEDIGSGVAGAARADIFFGAGAEAEAMAGSMAARGTLYIMLPKKNGD
jgi:membrane-bound lytic murein transglycosylase A